jgi:hypothetical protein
MRTRLLLPLLLLAGCAWEPGEGFAVLEPTVRVAYTPLADREAGDGFQRLSSDFQVRVSRASLELPGIELLGRSGGGGPTSFDPANPPPGYSLCHGGHCHNDAGALIPYEDIEAELGGGATTTPVATLPVGSVDLLTPETREVACQPDCELPNTTVSRGRWSVTGLHLEGVVRDSRQPPRFAGERPFRLELSPTGVNPEPVVVISGDLDVPSDREHDPRVSLELMLEVTPAVFDAVDWAATTVGPNGVVDLSDLEDPDNTAARTALLEHFAALQPEAEVTRDDR